MNSVIMLQNLPVLVSAFYLCLAIYSLYLATFISIHKRPIVTDSNLFNTIILIIFSLAAYYLFYCNQTFFVTIIYVLFIFGLFLLIVVSSSKFRIIGSEERVHCILKKVLLVLNIPFVNNKNEFELLGLDNTITIKKTLFSIFHIVMNNGKDKKLLNRIRLEFKNYYKNNEVILYRRGVTLFFVFSFLFFIFSGLCIYYSMHFCL